MPPKTLYPKLDPLTFPIKFRERELKIVVCVSLVWIITFLFLIIAIWFLHNLISKGCGGSTPPLPHRNKNLKKTNHLSKVFIAKFKGVIKVGNGCLWWKARCCFYHFFQHFRSAILRHRLSDISIINKSIKIWLYFLIWLMSEWGKLLFAKNGEWWRTPYTHHIFWKHRKL